MYCPICVKVFKMEEILESHLVRDHLHWQFWKCALCATLQYTKLDLKFHSWDVHRIRDPKLVVFMENKEKEEELKWLLQLARDSKTIDSEFTAPIVTVKDELNLVNKQEWLKKYAKDRREDGVMLMIKKAIDLKYADKGPSNSGITVKNEIPDEDEQVNIAGPSSANSDPLFVNESKCPPIHSNYVVKEEPRDEEEEPEFADNMSPAPSSSKKRKSTKSSKSKVKEEEEENADGDEGDGTGTVRCRRCKWKVVRRGLLKHAFLHLFKTQNIGRYKCVIPGCEFSHHYKEEVVRHNKEMHGKPLRKKTTLPFDPKILAMAEDWAQVCFGKNYKKSIDSELKEYETPLIQDKQDKQDPFKSIGRKKFAVFCQICQKEYIYHKCGNLYKRVFDHFSRHMHNDHGSSRYRCKVCDYSNAIYTTMTNHVTLKHRHKDCKNYIEDLSENWDEVKIRQCSQRFVGDPEFGIQCWKNRTLLDDKPTGEDDIYVSLIFKNSKYRVHDKWS
ncbi:hypothetical protein WR25_06155 isoform D [Diploscapter pachys]|uniref:C2H2-type domain-containing protein n=2 Tax=Diploscapter pachys TaxID=2018661 RepID=A0A2A2KQS3_9BILA|nr:hypothetical protein WR25_06155 isoform D [Diploscapter pachys]